MNVKIGILGASNALLGNGWHSVVSQAFDCTKHAIGGSNSGIGLYKINQYDLINLNDITIINFGVTEHEELKGNFISKTHLNHLVSELYKPFKFSKNHCISLLMPIKSVLDNNEEDLSLRIHEMSCKNAGGIFINGYDFIRELLKNNASLTTNDLFLDPHHLKPVIARFLGEVVKNAIYSLSNIKKNAIGIVQYDDFEFNAKTANIICKDTTKLTEIKNSIVDETVVKMHLNESISINDGDYIHGLFVDCSRSETKIKITTSTEMIVKNLFCRAPIIPADKPQLKFCTLHEPLIINDSAIMQVVANSVPLTESNRAERPLIENNNIAYICGLLTSKKCRFEREEYEFSSQKEIQEKINSLIINHANHCKEALSLLALDTTKIVNKLAGEYVKIDDILDELFISLKLKGYADAAQKLRLLIDKHDLNNPSPSDIELITKSTCFDIKYYLNTYPDILKAGVDPIKHYCEFGFREGRKPSAGFDTKAYMQKNHLDSNQNPLVHYIKSIIKPSSQL